MLAKWDDASPGDQQRVKEYIVEAYKDSTGLVCAPLSGRAAYRNRTFLTPTMQNEIEWYGQFTCTKTNVTLQIIWRHTPKGVKTYYFRTDDALLVPQFDDLCL